MATSSSSNKQPLPARIHELERHMPKRDAVRRRAEIIEGQAGTVIPNIKSYTIDPGAVGKNIENMIGAVQIPLGIAGPLRINGRFYRGEAFIPLATTEGALVASVNRGCKALNEGNGVNARLITESQTRAPLFEADDTDAAIRIADYSRKNQAELIRVARGESRHLKIKEIRPYIYGRLVWLRIKAETGNAMGMNMISIASESLALHVERKVKGARYLAASGNLCTDKKPAALTLVEGRGRFVIAEATLSGRTVREVLKSGPKEIERLNTYKNIIGSAIAGSYGLNAHYANVVSGIYAATGQDLAHVVEGSHGITHAEARKGALSITVTLPSLQVGTIGGGTSLPTQQEGIRLMGIDPLGEHSANKLAEVTAAAVLAGEVSLLAALASRQLVDAHKRLNR